MNHEGNTQGYSGTTTITPTITLTAIGGYVWYYPPTNPAVCPGCGRCLHCGGHTQPFCVPHAPAYVYQGPYYQGPVQTTLTCTGTHAVSQ